ncbi:ubiquitin carboxyl-terminal hydrolase 20 [Tribolium castaneum]|uniref:Ubiquitin carboxyl-terminal hydrolase n=1 Tax=Tribolium castaneum TaxID=7070 RepID=D6WRB7_TRICA|nr:PREDICTED: ubiquitin carboxyl-terminal hydrolase 20 [Tribolium castaneum]XP_008195142.1 PREDICTED: ubiquitin carboxyl-terminal hydrolase 20 [Tribolium castaneum]XP_972079.2 PREDICTED: ubiquitin carboxyl-terminal hydrolase 20 [Tribolium castaneum]EFA07675.2 Ubiquitin carboxyl-terminal hydrolase 20-like Protein [Tribolium castaneum]|eukprot:XP_008195141.1 PREDICTED: ubiquitin carboxyl-terminal hydrolase 20 [Tribolium castaneum]
MYSCSHLATATNIPIANILNSIERPVCADCGCTKPNLWICLFSNCLQICCGEKFNDHSTIHNSKNPTHCIHMNLVTKRIWCYECKGEVFMEQPSAVSSTVPSYDSDPEMEGCTYKSRDSGHGSYSTLRTNTPERMNVFAFEKTVGLNVGMSGDASDASDAEDSTEYSIDRPVGLVGLQNIGNTCYMNAALQALSNAIPLTRFFLECATTVQILSEGKKPGLSRTYQTLIRDMWKKNGGYVTPSGILYGIRSVYPMFRGYYQHDTQEFLRNFMDQLHEELKQVAPPEVATMTDSDTFSLAMDEPALSSSYDSSEGEYETCDSGVSERSSLSDDTERPASSTKRRLSRSSSPGRRIRTRLQSNTMVIDSQPSTSSSSASINKKQQKYRSIISDIFDGKLLSSVQCLTCDRVSSCVETFQDLSLPIPSRDHLVVLHGRTTGPTATCSEAVIPMNEGWISWILAWLKSWFYGPVVTLHDCLAAFFSTDELKGDNMYSCEKCNKLRNGIKFSKVLQLPEVLCIHLKRFRHELMFSSKISSAVSFPLKGLDMRPYLHTDCISKVTTYELFSVICHYGTAGGGHYICYALNGGQWYEFDDQYVTRVPPEKVQSCEAYVLFYRKVTNTADEIRSKAIKLAKTHSTEPHEVAYISKQWISRFNTCAEPGAIDNSDFLCQHGSFHPDREIVFERLAVALPLPVYEYLHKKFGGCPPVTSINICPACLAFNNRLLFEMETFVQLNREMQNKDVPLTHLISTSWYTQWHKFVQKRAADAPGPIDNSKINMNQIDVNECAEITEGIWNFFFNIYGGGPELRLRPKSLHRTESESSLPSDGGEQTKFVIPALKKEKVDTIDKSVYCSGEPMEVEEIEGENECNGFAEEGDSPSDTLPNGICAISHSKLANVDNDVSDDEVCNVEVKNSKRHRRRRKALSNIN